MEVRSVLSRNSLLDTLELDLKSRSEKPEVGLESLPLLSAKTHGFRYGLNIVAGRPSMGKTAIISQFAMDFASQGHVTLVLSLEDDPEYIAERMYCNRYKINNEILHAGGFNLNQDYRDKWAEFRTWYAKLPLLITYGIGGGMEEVNEFVAKVSPKPKVVILDYVQKTRSGYKERENLQNYVHRFDDYTASNKIVGIVCSQIGRADEKGSSNRPSLDGLKGTGSLEESARLAFLLHWPYWYSNKEEEKNRYDINIAKNKKGPTGVHKLVYYPQFYRFEEVAEAPLAVPDKKTTEIMDQWLGKRELMRKDFE